MILDSTQVGEIFRGRRTQTRRPVDSSESGYRVRTGRRGQSRSLHAPYQPRVGERFPVKTRPDAEPSCTLTVVAFDQQRHGDITADEIRRSGYSTVTSYKEAWVRQYDAGWIRAATAQIGVVVAVSGLGLNITPRSAARLAAVSETAADDLRTYYRRDMREALSRERGIRVTERDPDAESVTPFLTPAMFVARFDRHHADKLVWVLHHKIATETPANLLAARPGSAQTDYVHSPAQAMGGDLDPGEAVDRATIARLGEQAELRQKQGVTADWLELRRDVEKRIRDLEASHDLAPKDVKLLNRLRYQLEKGDDRFAA